MAAPVTPPLAFDMAAGAADGFESPTSQPHPLLPQPVPGPRLIDTKAIGKLRAFSGKDEDWPAWVFVARGYVHLLDRAYRGMLEAAENAASQNELSTIDMSDTAQELSTVLFNLLTQSVDGRGLQILMNVEGQNGFQAWKALCDAYEPPVGGRHMAMLTAIIAPDWKNIKESEILETIESWEVLVRRYEMQSKETVSESMRVAVLMKHVPSPVKDAMRAAGTQIGTNYERAKKFIRDYLQTGNIYKSGGALAKDDGGLAPMDVGAVSHAEKGKKGKSSKGDKGVNKGGKYDAVPTEAETDEKKAKIKTFEEEPTEPTLNQGGPSSGSGRNDEPILISEKPANVEPSQEAMETEQTSPPWRSRSLQDVPDLVEMMKTQKRGHAWAEYMLEHCTRRPRM